MTPVQIRQIQNADAESFRECLDAVARERCYLAQVEAPPLAKVQQFVADSVANDAAQYVATLNGQVVGWYRTSFTPEGYCVESDREPGSVQIYPAAALRRVQEPDLECFRDIVGSLQCVFAACCVSQYAYIVVSSMMHRNPTKQIKQRKARKQ
jgi:hypothetical protein